MRPSRHDTGRFGDARTRQTSHFVTQRPSDPGIQQPGYPVDPVTLFYVRIEYSVEFFLSSTRVLDKVSKLVKVFISAFQMYVLHFGHFFENRENSGLTPGQNDDPGVKDDPLTR